MCTSRDFRFSAASAFSAAAIALAALLFSSALSARPVELVTPNAPGGYIDIMGRALGEEMSKKWNDPVVVLNKVGGGSVLATQYTIADTAADGHNILLNAGAFLINQFKAGGSPYDPNALSPILIVCMNPIILYTRSTIPANNYREFVSWAKQNPKGVAFGSSGVGSPPHIFAEMLAASAGFNIIHVPHRGNAPAVAAMIGGHLDAVFDASATRSFVQTGQLRALLVGDSKPVTGWPDLPTADAAGATGFRSVSWYGLWVSAKTPPAIQAKLNADINQILTTPGLKDKIGCEPSGGTAAAAAAFLSAERERLGNVIKTRNINID